MNEKIARETINDLIRNTRFRLEFDTANSSVTANKGVRARVGFWYMPTDFVLMKDLPELISTGERVMLAGFSSVWITGKHPCFVSPGSQYIIIFCLEGVLPIWSPSMESSDEMLGTFEFWHNCFKERCDIYINSNGEVCLDIPAPRSYIAEYISAVASTTHQPLQPPMGSAVSSSSGASAARAQTLPVATGLVDAEPILMELAPRGTGWHALPAMEF